MKLAIMQPYFMPYIGYWQLFGMVDTMVIYDNVQYTKKGWINRNRFLLNGRDVLFTIPLKKASDFLDIHQRSVADDFDPDKILNSVAANYRKAPFFETAYPLIDSIVRAQSRNLFDFIHESIRSIACFLEIKTPLVVSSNIATNHSLRGQEKVIALCKAMGANHYINTIGGQELYSKAEFLTQGITLEFIKSKPICYRQFTGDFVPNLSIIDVMMFNSREAIRAMLGEYELV
jgi:hypothetical protein